MGQMSDMGRYAFHLGVNTLFHVPGDIGGTETYLRELLLAMAQYFTELRLTLFTSLDNDAMLRDLFAGNPQVTTHSLSFRAANRPLRIIMEQMVLPFVVKKSGVDVLWSPGYTMPFWAHCPQVVTVHDLQYKSHPYDLSRLEKVTFDALVRIACRRSEKIISVSQFSKDEIVKYGFAEANKVCTVLEGVDPSFAENDTETISVKGVEKIVLPAKPFLLCVANTYPHKNVHLLVEAFARICHAIPHNLVLVGKARLGESAVQQAVAHLSDPLRFIRYQDGIPFPLLQALYRHADAFVLPSAYEGFGLPVLEAMMACTPVVISRIASLPEVAGDHAWYFQEGDVESLVHQIQSVITLAPEERFTRCQRAQTWAQGFSWKNAAQQTLDVLAGCRSLS